MSLRTRLESLVSAIGADIKALRLADVQVRWAPVQFTAGYNVSMTAPVFTGLMITPKVNDRVLLYGQNQDYQNGLYRYQGVGQPLLRTDDADNPWEFVFGKLVFDQYLQQWFQYTGSSDPAVGGQGLPFYPVMGYDHSVATELDVVDTRLDVIERSVAEPCFAVYTSNVVLANEFISSSIFPGDRVLLVGQTVKADNGVYTPTPDTGSGSFLTRDTDEVYFAGKLFPIVTKSKLSTDDDYANPVVYSCTDFQGSDKYAFAQVSAPAVAQTLAAGDRVISVAGQTSVNISGLDGDQDVAYEIRVLGFRAAGGSGGVVTLRPNGLTTGTDGLYHQTFSEPGVTSPTHSLNDITGLTGMGMGVVYTVPVQSSLDIEGTLQAKTGQGSRTYRGTAATVKNASRGHANQVWSARWDDATTKITSLTIDFGGTFTGDIVLRAIGTSRTSNAHPAGAKVIKPSATQSIPTSAWTKLTWKTIAEFDNALLWDAANNRFVAPQSGLYKIATGLWATVGGTNAYWALAITKNTAGVQANVGGATFVAKTQQLISTNTPNLTEIHLMAEDVVWLNAGDHIEAWVWHNAGSAKNVGSAASGDEHLSRFSAVRMPSGADVAYPEPWRNIGAAGNPPFQNSWTHFDSTVFGPVAFRKAPDGKVVLRGTVKSGVNDSVIFTLPVGYRPSVVVDRMVKGGTNSTAQVNLIRVNKDGTVQQTARNGGTNDAVALDGVEFYTD